MSKKDPNAVAPQSLTDLQTMAATGDEMAKSLLEAIDAGKLDLNKALEHLQKGTSTIEDLVKGCDKPAKSAGPAGQDAANGGKTTKLSKMDDEDEGEEEEKEQEEEDGKSLEQGDLMKAVKVASQVAAGASSGAEPDRRAELAKALNDGTISADEQVELASLLGGGEEDLDEPLERSYTDVGMQDPDVQGNHTTGDDFDVSAFLGRFVAFVGNSLDEINTGLGKSLGRVHSYNQAQSSVNEHLAKALVSTSALVKSQAAVIDAMGTRMGILEAQPVGRRSVPTAKALDKSMEPAGGQPHTTDQPNPGVLGPPRDGGSDITPDNIVKGLTMLQRQSEDGKSPSGHDITTATAHFESHKQIHPDVLGDVKKVLGK
jgi:hypothetical protein